MMRREFEEELSWGLRVVPLIVKLLWIIVEVDSCLKSQQRWSVFVGVFVLFCVLWIVCFLVCLVVLLFVQF